MPQLCLKVANYESDFSKFIYLERFINLLINCFYIILISICREGKKLPCNCNLLFYPL